MIDQLIVFDKKVLIYLNNIYSLKLDHLIYFLSESLLPGIVIFTCIFCAYFFKIRQKFFQLLISALIVVGVSDFTSSSVLKPFFKRLRPCADPQISNFVRTPGHKCTSSKYGFVSSHAANTFALATFFSLTLYGYSKFILLLYPYAFFISYTRIYLGKHYPGDLLFGALLGVLIAFAINKLANLLIARTTRLGFFSK